MTNDPRIDRQKQALKATTSLLRHWTRHGVNVGDPLPPTLDDAAAVLQNVPAVDLLRLVASNKATLSSLLR